MNNDKLLMQRRAFLKTGATGGLIAAAIPLSQLTAAFPVDTSPRDGGVPSDTEPHRALRKVILRYGGEFGEVGKEY
jgi:hypothetical protein